MPATTPAVLIDLFIAEAKRCPDWSGSASPKKIRRWCPAAAACIWTAAAPLGIGDLREKDAGRLVGQERAASEREGERGELARTGLIECDLGEIDRRPGIADAGAPVVMPTVLKVPVAPGWRRDDTAGGIAIGHPHFAATLGIIANSLTQTGTELKTVGQAPADRPRP